MSSRSTFPPHATIVPLRWDFAIELGILELREPVDQEFFDDLRAKDPNRYRDIDLAGYNRIRDSFARPVLPHFLLVYGAVPPNDNEVTKWVWTGREHFQTHDQGLWGDMLSRIKVAYEGAHPPIYPPKVQRLRETWTMPEFALVHDTTTGTAAIVEWNTAVRYPAFNTRPRTNRERDST